MHRVKGFSGGIDPSVFSSGALHEIQSSNLNNAVVFDGAITAEHHDAIRSGIPVVSVAYADQVRLAHNLEVNPTKIISADRSAHGVGFGKFVGRTFGNSTSGRLLDVALKPFDNPEDALNEASGYLWLGRLMIETFEPVGIFPARNGSHVVGATKRRRDLMSLDRDEWAVGGRVDDEHKAEIAERNERTVVDIAGKMAFIHAHGGFLPDGQIKNWAVTPEGEIGAIDTENFVVLETGHIDAPSRAWDDINKLVKSLVLDTRDKDEAKMFGVGMFAGLPLPQLRSAIERLVINPYVAELEKLFSETNDEEKHQQIYDLSQTLLSRFHDDPKWPSHFAQMQNQHRATRKTLARA